MNGSIDPQHMEIINAIDRIALAQSPERRIEIYRKVKYTMEARLYEYESKFNLWGFLNFKKWFS